MLPPQPDSPSGMRQQQSLFILPVKLDGGKPEFSAGCFFRLPGAQKNSRAAHL